MRWGSYRGYKQELVEARLRTKKREILLEAARELGIPKRQAEEIIRKVNK